MSELNYDMLTQYTKFESDPLIALLKSIYYILISTI